MRCMIHDSRKVFENTALYSPDELERLDKHIEKYFGKSTTVVHEFLSEDIHVDVSIIPPHEGHNLLYFGNHRYGCVFNENPK